ncbi:MAG: Crp/Fnr family transcriptional regulator [Rubripirellula sp.]
MPPDRIDLLRKMPVFGGLKTESLQLILGESSEVVVKEGDCYFREGEPGDSLFVLESGTVLVQRMWQGEAIELGRLASGDCFGEMALIDFQKRSATIKAECNCSAIEVPSKSLRSLFKFDLEQYAMIMMNLGREVSRRLRIADECLFQLQQAPANEEG